MIRLHGVRKVFHRPLLLDIDLHIPRSSVLGLIGPAAAGKTVLLRLLCGLLRADSGVVEIDGSDAGQLDHASLAALQARFGVLFQQNALFDFMNVYDNVAFPLRRTTTLSSEAIDQRVRQRLRQVGLIGSEEKFPTQLSGGMRKRCAIARASVTRPEILIYDEPTAGLDPVTTSRIYDLLRADQAATRSTVVVVSSDVDGLKRFAPCLAMLYQGRIVYHGSAQTIDDADDPVVRQFVRGELAGPL